MKLGKALKKSAKILSSGLLVAIFLLIFGIYWQLSSSNSGSEADLKEAIIQYGQDLNEMRSYLNLAQHEYDFFKSDAETDLSNFEAQEDLDYEIGIAKFVNTLSDEKKHAETKVKMEEILNALIYDGSFGGELGAMGLGLSREVNISDDYAKLNVLVGSDPLVQITGDIHNDQLSLKSIKEDKVIEITDESPLGKQVLDYLRENKDPIFGLKQRFETQKEGVKQFLDEQAVIDLLNERHLSMNAGAIETEAGHEFYVTDSNGSPLITILIDRASGDFKMAEVVYKDLNELRDSLVSKLKTLDGESDESKNIKSKKEALESYLKSDAFMTELNTSGIIIAEARNEGSNIYYDLLLHEEKIASVIFDTIKGEVRFIKVGESIEIQLEEILSGSKKKP